MDIATLWSITRWENLSIFVFDDSQTPERGLWIFNLAPLMVQLILCRILILDLLKTMIKLFFCEKMFLIVLFYKALNHIKTAFPDLQICWDEEGKINYSLLFKKKSLLFNHLKYESS